MVPKGLKKNLVCIVLSSQEKAGGGGGGGDGLLVKEATVG